MAETASRVRPLVEGDDTGGGDESRQAKRQAVDVHELNGFRDVATQWNESDFSADECSKLDLPPELFGLVAINLDWQSIKRMLSTCKTWRTSWKNQEFWEVLCKAHYPRLPRLLACMPQPHPPWRKLYFKQVRLHLSLKCQASKTPGVFADVLARLLAPPTTSLSDYFYSVEIYGVQIGDAKHPKAMLQEMLHQADMGVVEYREALTADGRVAVDVYLNGQKLNATPSLGVDFKAASTAAAQEVITQLQAAQGPADPAAPPPEKPKYLRPQDKGGRPGDGTVPSGGGGSANGSQHPRTLLQELVHAFPALGELRYDQLEDAGLNQPGRYLVGVTLGGQLLATARGRNKKDASTAAAAQALVICQSRVAGMERQQTYAPAMMGGGAT